MAFVKTKAGRDKQMKTQKAIRCPTWSLQVKEKSRCELKVKFYSDDGSEHDAEYCFPCAKDCLYWISHEIVMLVKGEKKPSIGSDLLQEIKV